MSADGVGTAAVRLRRACRADGADPTAVQTEAPTEAPTEPQPTEPALAAVVPAALPETDSATGTLVFYIGGKQVYAGGALSELLDAGVHTYADPKIQIAPYHISDIYPVRIELADVAEDDRPFIFFTAINAGAAPCELRDCLIYSLTVNGDAGIRFGSGKEAEPFVTGTTTYDELLAVYGEPDYDFSNDAAYREWAYYKPFSCAYFSSKRNVIRQIQTYYCADIPAMKTLAEENTLELDGYFGCDAAILMSQYLDVAPYLKAEDTGEKHLCADLDEFIVLEGEKIEFGKKVSEMPEVYAEPFKDLTVILDMNRYMRTGRVNDEEFFLLNDGGMKDYIAYNAVVKGIITQNRNYTNWGFDFSGFHEFSYQGLTNDATIGDVLRLFGEPAQMFFTSSAKAAFVWMHYTDAAGNTLHICVDPMLDQIVELKVSKYFDKERTY